MYVCIYLIITLSMLYILSHNRLKRPHSFSVTHYMLSHLQVSFVVYTTSRPLLRVFAVSLALLYMIGLALTLSGAVFPYSGGSQPAPKRLFLQVENYDVPTIPGM